MTFSLIFWMSVLWSIWMIYSSTQITCLNITGMLKKYSSVSTRLVFMPKQRNINFTSSQQNIWNMSFFLLVLLCPMTKSRLSKTGWSPRKSRIFNPSYILQISIASLSSTTQILSFYYIVIPLTYLTQKDVF